MDYFSVIVLVIVVFVFITDKKAKTVQIIEREDKLILNKVQEIRKDLKIIKITTKDMCYEKILKIIQDLKQEYVLIQNSKINLKEENITKILANYISENKRPCGFNLVYSYSEKKWTLKKVYIDIINYLNIFNKQELATYGVIILKKNDKIESEKIFKETMISYLPEEFTNINFTKNEIKKEKMKKIYLDKINKADIWITLKFLLFVISGTIITTNLIYSILNLDNINSVIISGVIYYCYSYIIRHIYIPIGKQRVIASYIFPIYFIAYIIVNVNSVIAKVIKRVQV